MTHKLYTLLVALVITATIFAQAPEKLSYQAVVRDASNTIVSNQAVGMQISVLQTTASGTAVYVETQTPTTNASGLVSIEIGMGNVVSGDFSAIDWSAGPYFIKTETDPAGGTNYTITGTNELLSVPYALYAKISENAQNVGDVKQGFQTTDHKGWIKLDGRAISTLTATQQAQVNLLGFSGNLPNATNAYLSQNEQTLGVVSGANMKSIAQNQLPDATLSGSTNSAGDHTHTLRLSTSGSGSGGVQNGLVTNNASTSQTGNQILSGGIHSHTLTTTSLNGGVTQVDFDVKPQTMSVNVFIYLGD